MAEGVLTKYVINLATRASGPAQLVGQLQTQVAHPQTLSPTIWVEAGRNLSGSEPAAWVTR